MLKAAEIREKFLAYFETQGHTRVASSSLIPANDPTLLFANAGMNQFKERFLGLESTGYQRATSSQKCVRAGGKHNDLDNVGYTARHNTFFEMLGNFSFGDYFKSEAIYMAWTFLTGELEIPKDRLYVTVYEDDDEALAIWRDTIGVPEDRIFRFGKKDNFWSMGDTGPCGPCSEIFYDYGDMVAGPSDPYEAIASGSDKIVEVWNLVFMQYDSQPDGTLAPLPNPSIDTGMGLERITTVMQQVLTNFETDLLRDIMEPVAGELSINLGDKQQDDTALRVIADHLRAMSFLIADGVVPSNEGRGYVLRRIMRRAMRYGKQLGQETPFLHRMVRYVVEKMGDAYPELHKEHAQIELLVKVEEQQFDSTLSKGMPILTRYLDQFSNQNLTAVPGQVVHYMYGTHGFPIDLMNDIARDWNMTLDMDGYQQIMNQEAEQNRASGEFTTQRLPDFLLQDSKTFQTEMTCYGGLSDRGTIRRMLQEDSSRDRLEVGCQAQIILDRTPFYAESGGQIGDRGTLKTASGSFQVTETTKILDKLVLHQGEVIEGHLETGQEASLDVDPNFRRNTMKNHTATHLLHQALREVLGLHVRQAGSLVDPEKLRFDFSHFSPMTADEVAEVEALVNREIWRNEALDVREMDLENARHSGAIAMFGEKYGDRVRVVSIGEFSKEFCGGTHVHATGEIGCFKLISEKGLAAGIRRIIALTGPKALARFQESERLLKETQDRFFFQRETLVEQLQKQQEEKRLLKDQIEALKLKLAKGGSASEQLEEVGSFKVLVKQVSDVSGGQLRQLGDELLQKIKTGVVLLGSEADGKAQLLVKANVAAIHCGKLVGAMAQRVDGKGGGRPDMAMAGGKNAAGLAEALAQGLEMVKKSAN